MSRTRTGIFPLLVLLASCGVDKPPYSPEQALKRFVLPEGFRIELVAAEPLIADPVEIAFDADGRMYVAEMADYPADGVPRSRVSLLEDTDGDGFYETSAVFAEDLPYANGVMPWKKGVLVASAPDIIYLEDTTGDAMADVRRVLLTGFAETNPQLRMSGLRYGMDNWIYGAYSRSGGARGYPEFSDHGRPLRFPGDPEADSADIYPGTDFRFRPDEFRVEPSGGMSQFGLSFDAAGNRFTVWNNRHLSHVVLDARYMNGNAWLSAEPVMASVPDHGDAAPVYSIAEGRLDLHESEIGHFTSACGHAAYTGGIFPGEYGQAVFVCEPVSNIVHVDLLSSEGATFSGKRFAEEKEFLGSADSWFRPVNTTVGPDGALYVVDFYRKLVEHPAWIAHADEEGIYTHAGVLQEADFLEGRDRGRIYRIVPEDFKRGGAERPRLSAADAEALAGYLEHPNGWWRTTAQRILVERQDTAAVPRLKELAESSDVPLARMHALWTLHGLGKLDKQLAGQALDDPSPLVRKQAVLLAEGRLPDQGLTEKLAGMASDPDPHVQLQVALTLGILPQEHSFDPVLQIVRQHIGDPWFRTAGLLGASQNANEWFRAIGGTVYAAEKEQEGKQAFLRKAAAITGARRQSEEISALLDLTGALENEPALQAAALQGINEGLSRASTRLSLSAAGQDRLLKLLAREEPELREAASELAARIHLANSPALRTAVARAGSVVRDGSAEAAERAFAVKVLGLDPSGPDMALFEDLLNPRQPAEVQLAAVKILLGRGDAASTRLLISHWDAYTAEVRGVVESGFLRAKNRASALVQALAAGEISPTVLSRSSRNQLRKHSDPGIKEQAEAVFAGLEEETRGKVVRAYHEATTGKGDREKGKTVFKAVCSTCHLLNGEGHKVGPDLLSVTNQTRMNLLVMILDPNESIAPGYDAYTVVTTSGQTHAGMMVQESATSVTIRTAGGEEQTLPRDQIDRVRPMGISLMPDGLETSISVEEMADLLEYLKNP